VSEKLKKRLIGAVVLVALAAIFIPMLFNGGEQTEMPTFGTNLPPQPKQRFATIEVPLQIPPPKPVETRVVTTQQEAKAQERQEVKETAPSAPPKPTAARPATAETEKPFVVPPVKPQAVKPTLQPAVAVKPAGGWAVQLGSFEKSANALAFRDKVRKQGYAAFVEQQKGSSATVYRVRVGPEIKRETADALKAKLEKAGLKGVVMPHP
jgi:DedD protein